MKLQYFREIAPNSASHRRQRTRTQSRSLLIDFAFNDRTVINIGKDSAPERAFCTAAEKEQLISNRGEPSKFVESDSQSEGNSFESGSNDVRLGMAEIQTDKRPRTLGPPSK